MKQIILCLLAFTLLAPAGETSVIRVFVTSSNRSEDVVKAETVSHINKNKHCRTLTVTINRKKADYIIVHDDTGAGPGRKPQKIAVFKKDGDLIYSGSTRRVSSAIKDACKAIKRDLATPKEPMKDVPDLD